MGKGPYWDESLNVVTGCTPCSEGCANCYAKRLAETRLRGRHGYPADEPFRVTLHPERLDQPRHWRKKRRVFVCDMGDLFHEAVPDGFIEEVMAVAALCPQHTFLLLTKRVTRMAEFCRWIDSPSGMNRADMVQSAMLRWVRDAEQPEWPVPNIWLGATIENQQRFDERAPYLAKLSAAGWNTWVSYEPALGPLDMSAQWLDPDHWESCGLRWLVAGCERLGSRPGRPAPLLWFRDARDQCITAGVPFFLKQAEMNLGEIAKLPRLDGVQWTEVPK